MKKLVKPRELSRNKTYWLLLIVMVFCSTNSIGQNTSLQFFGGINIIYPGFTLQANKAIGKRFKIATNYHFYRIRGADTFYSNGVSTGSQSYDINESQISVTAEYLIFKSKGETFHGLSIGLGPGYASVKRNQLEYLNGFGAALKLEYQVNIYKNLYLGAESYHLYFYNTNTVSSSKQWKLTYMPIIIKIGVGLN